MTLQTETTDGLRIVLDVVNEPTTLYSGTDAITKASSVAALVAFLQGHGRIPTSRESFTVLALDGRHKLCGVQVVSTGTLTASLVHPREVFRFAIASDAAAIIITHHHLSGNPEPSAPDRTTTTRIAKAGELLGIPLLDHVITAGDPTDPRRKAGMQEAAGFIFTSVRDLGISL